jgi:hypothetical protein
MIQRLFPYAIITLSLCASAVYYAHLDWRHGTYWLAAAVLNLSVTL